MDYSSGDDVDDNDDDDDDYKVCTKQRLDHSFMHWHFWRVSVTWK